MLGGKERSVKQDKYTYHEMIGCSSGIISAVIPFAGRNYLCCVFAVTTVSMFARFAFGVCKSQNQKCVCLEPVGRLRQHHRLHHLVSR